ncbi:hypothetical protein GAY28_03730 [Azospirillum brasilense]|nr:hypothetical protein [Azospirillum brasilense]
MSNNVVPLRHPSVRALAVPELGDAQLEDFLVLLREKYILNEFPRIPRECGILRRQMIRALVRIKPTTTSEFMRLVPGHLIAGTSEVHLQRCAGVVVTAIAEFLRLRAASRRK